MSRPSLEPAPPPAFLRRRVRPPRRRLLGVLARAAALVLVLAALAAAGFWTAVAVGRARELSVSRIRVEGNHRLDEREILASLGLGRETNILTVDLERLKAQLLRSPWIADAELARVLPATLTLRIVEREPVGIAVAADGLYLLAEDGVLLDSLGPTTDEPPLPLARGLLGADGAPDDERAALAGRVLGALGRADKIAEAVSEIDVGGGPDSLVVHLRRPPLTVLAREADLVARLAELLPLSEGLWRRFTDLEAVDLRFRDRIYLRRAAPVAAAEGGPAAPAGASGADGGTEGR